MLRRLLPPLNARACFYVNIHMRSGGVCSSAGDLFRAILLHDTFAYDLFALACVCTVYMPHVFTFMPFDTFISDVRTHRTNKRVVGQRALAHSYTAKRIRGFPWMLHGDRERHTHTHAHTEAVQVIAHTQHV